jgi:FKBP-type peptidyl-prolyl cis-trans isomerase FkpA
MSVTAVPLHPIKKGSVLKLWIALLVLLALAAGFAWYGTASHIFSKTASGLQYRVSKEGTGPHPTTNDVAIIEYTGRLADGTVFDSNKGRPAPIPVDPRGSIKGFSEGLQMMRKGGSYQLRIPPNLAYGEQGSPPAIPANATLDFDVTLVEFVPLETFRAMMAMQQGGAGGPGGPGGPAGQGAPPEMQGAPPQGAPPQGAPPQGAPGR